MHFSRLHCIFPGLATSRLSRFSHFSDEPKNGSDRIPTPFVLRLSKHERGVEGITG